MGKSVKRQGLVNGDSYLVTGEDPERKKLKRNPTQRR